MNMNFKILMKKINKTITDNSDLFESNKDELINKVLKESDQEIKKVVELNDPNLWENIHKRRDNLKLRMDILNKIMSFNQ